MQSLSLPEIRRDTLLSAREQERLKSEPLRVIAVTDEPWVVEKILRHLGAWHAPAPKPTPAPAALGSYTYETCDDMDPMPDYENVLTD